MLTDLQVSRTRPKSKRFEVLDGKGLYLRIFPTGGKSWIYRYQHHNTPRRMTLGQYPDMGVAEARIAHGEAMKLLKQGVDPGKAGADRARKARQEPTVKDMVGELWREEMQHRKSGHETHRMLEKDVYPIWGGWPVSAIKRRDIVLLLDGITARGAPITRNRVHSALTRLFNFACERGVIEDSPCTRIRKIPETPKSRVLNDAEIKSLWGMISLEDGESIFQQTVKLAFKLQLLTGQRLAEVAGMRHAELDLESHVWAIPATRMKGNIEHVLPITPTMEAVIIQAGNIHPEYVFPRPRGKDHITRQVMGNFLRDKTHDMGFTFSSHDIRRTVRTRLAELNVEEFLAERILGHKLSGVLGIYNRHTYLPEKKEALIKWEARLMEIVGGNHA